jgi:hypothetical protein
MPEASMRVSRAEIRLLDYGLVELLDDIFVSLPILYAGADVNRIRGRLKSNRHLTVLTRLLGDGQG